MPETRRRSFWDQVGVGGDRTRVGTSRGEGIVNGFSRLAAQSREVRPSAAFPGATATLTAFGTFTGSAMNWTGLNGFSVTDTQALQATVPGFYVVTIRCEIVAPASTFVEVALVAAGTFYDRFTGTTNTVPDPILDGLTAFLPLGTFGPSLIAGAAAGSTFDVRAAPVST